MLRGRCESNSSAAALLSSRLNVTVRHTGVWCPRTNLTCADAQRRGCHVCFPGSPCGRRGAMVRRYTTAVQSVLAKSTPASRLLQLAELYVLLKKQLELERPQDHWGWTGSFFFSATILSTIGYGSFAPQTIEAKWVSLSRPAFPFNRTAQGPMYRR